MTPGEHIQWNAERGLCEPTREELRRDARLAEIARRIHKHNIAEEVVVERIRQDALWGEQNHPDGTHPALFEYEAIVAKHRCAHAVRHGELTWQLILDEEVKEAFAESNPDKLRAELVQVAAVATCWIEAIDRRSK